jgi:8-oxo-dGTP pyrophosphatase MutT (NUDIX family)
VREAATVVVRRPGLRGQPREIYVIRRSARSPFMPSTIVFPGGRVDGSDGASDDPLRFHRAAMREAAEEASLDLREVPLRWFDTWLTPSLEARRYLARFYLADVELARSEAARPDGHEAVEGAWMSALALLDAWSRGELDLPPPTLSILRWLDTAPDLEAATRDEELALPILPKVVASGSNLDIVLPHHPDYMTLPGESGPAPRRLSRFPMRLRREGVRWIPLQA